MLRYLSLGKVQATHLNSNHTNLECLNTLLNAFLKHALSIS
jgi:hypothetical protein